MFPSEEYLRNHKSLKPLLTIAKRLKCQVLFNNSVSRTWWLGFYDPRDKTIHVNTRGPDGRFWGLADIAFILAHEVKHALHDRHRQFPVNYLNPKPRDESPINKDLREVLREYYAERAYDAELDCDAYARSFVDKFFSPVASTLYSRVYPKWRIHKSLLSGQDLRIRVKVESVFNRGMTDEQQTHNNLDE